MVTRTLPPAKLGWMAGVIDLRGKVVRKNNKQRAEGSRQVVMWVESKEYPIIQALCAMVGTSVELMKTPDKNTEFMRRGCAEHCPASHVHVDGPVWPSIARWTISGCAMGVVLWNLLPYLQNTGKPYKPLMAEVFAASKLTGQGSGATAAAVRRLEGLGWVIPPQIVKRMKGAEPDGVDEELGESEVG